MAVCPLILNFLHISSQKWLVFGNYFSLSKFYPNWPIFLHGYIRHIRNILQPCGRMTLILHASEVDSAVISLFQRGTYSSKLQGLFFIF